MSMGSREAGKQTPLWVATSELARGGGHVFYRKLNELKTVGLMRKTRHRGTDLVGWMFQFAAAAYNLVRMRNLCAAAA